MRDSSLIQVFTPPANHFVIYGGQMVMSPARGDLIFPAMIIWEVRIGGRNFTNPSPLFTRNTVLLSQTDLRSGLLFAMQGPLFRQVILSARLVAIEPMAVQGGRVTMTLDPSVGLTGGAADLKVRVGDLVG